MLVLFISGTRLMVRRVVFFIEPFAMRQLLAAFISYIVCTKFINGESDILRWSEKNPESSQFPPFRGSSSSSTGSFCPKVATLNSQCQAPSSCSLWRGHQSTPPLSKCTLANGAPGLCCPLTPTSSDHSGKIQSEVDSAAKQALSIVKEMEEKEQTLEEMGVMVMKNSAASTQLLFHPTTSRTMQIGRAALIAYETSNILRKRLSNRHYDDSVPSSMNYSVTDSFVYRRLHLSRNKAHQVLSKINLRDTILNEFCPQEPICTEVDASWPYRSMDGSCNNLRRGGWGQSRTQFQRMLPNEYGDGDYVNTSSDTSFMKTNQVFLIS